MDKNNFIEKTEIEGLLIINRPIFNDDRGFFREIGQAKGIDELLGITFRPIQFNHSLSNIGVIRGIHAEAWNKLVYPVTGKMFGAYVDIRPTSNTFGKVFKTIIDDANRHSLFIPHGVANSICALPNNKNEPVNYVYMVDAYYNGTDTTAIAWNDPDLKIEWPIKDPIVSNRDKENKSLRELFPDKFSK